MLAEAAIKGSLNINDEAEVLDWWTKSPSLASRQDFGAGVHLDLGKKNCQKCTFREEPDEIYSTHIRFSDGRRIPLLLSKMIAEELAKDNIPRVIPTRFLRALIWQNEFIEDHVAHVAHIDTPGIVAMGFLKLQGQEAGAFSYLIDGTHRAVGRIREKREFPAYILTARDTYLCATRTRTMLGERSLLDPTTGQVMKAGGV